MAVPGEAGATEGWYPSPDDPDLWRYWDGEAWTAVRRRRVSGRVVGAGLFGASALICAIAAVILRAAEARCTDFEWLSAAREECESGIPDAVVLAGLLGELLVLPLAVVGLILGLVGLVRAQGVRESRWAWAAVGASLASIVVLFSSVLFVP